MIHVILPFLTAIALSGIAAYYSVIGLAQIFPGSYWPIIIMGSVLEAAKLVTVKLLTSAFAIPGLVINASNANNANKSPNNFIFLIIKPPLFLLDSILIGLSGSFT